jgi:hypothetical protein
VEGVREMLKHGSIVGSAENSIWKTLNVAALEDHVQVFLELLKYCAGVDCLNKKGWTPLKREYLNGHVDSVNCY